MLMIPVSFPAQERKRISARHLVARNSPHLLPPPNLEAQTLPKSNQTQSYRYERIHFMLTNSTSFGRKLEPFRTLNLSAISRAMSRPEPPSFHVRLPSDLKARLEAVRGSKSLNKEIIERLERSFTHDWATELGDILKPYLGTLDEKDRARVVKLATEAIGILAEGQKQTNNR